MVIQEKSCVNTHNGAVTLHDNSTRTEMATTSLLTQEIDAAYQRMIEARNGVNDLLAEVSESPDLTTAKAVLEERSHFLGILKKLRDEPSERVRYIDPATVNPKGRISNIPPEVR